MTQRELVFPPTDRKVHPEDAPRLSGQSLKILERLKIGPATNIELYEICLRPGARVFDLKAAGWNIKSRRNPGGTWTYWIEQ